jgi:hypothetical protein
MDVEWQLVKLPIELEARRLKGIIVRTKDGQEAMIPFFEIGLTENKELKTLEEKCRDYRDRFIAKLEEMKKDVYFAACENNDRPPTMALVFISEDLTLIEDTAKHETFAHAEIGVACFDEEIDLEQFSTLGA